MTVKKSLRSTNYNMSIVINSSERDMRQNHNLVDDFCRTLKVCLGSAVLVLNLFVGSIFAKELKIGTIEVAPFGFHGVDGKSSGMMYEIGNRIAEEAGFTYTNELLPYPRTSHNLESGITDFVLRFNNDELPTIAHQVVSIVSMPSIIIGKQGSKFSTLSDLHGKTVGILPGGKFDDKFAADAAIKKYDSKDYRQMLKMIQTDRLDAAIGSNVGLYYTAGLLKIPQDQLSEPLVLSSQDFVLHFSKKTADEKTLTSLKVAVEKLKRSGEIKKIIDKYMVGYKWEVSAK
jgi:ABC-type amino acid transport substrate-binding protein